MTDATADVVGDGDRLAPLREAPANTFLFRGYGPLVIAAVLLLLMVVLAPTIAPERLVEVEGPVSTTVSTATTVVTGG